MKNLLEQLSHFVTKQLDDVDHYTWFDKLSGGIAFGYVWSKHVVGDVKNGIDGYVNHQGGWEEIVYKGVDTIFAICVAIIITYLTSIVRRSTLKDRTKNQ